VKTISLKKVSAVAVASLGFGLLSVVPANAAASATTATWGLASGSTATPTVGSVVTLPITVAVTGTQDATSTSVAEFTITTKPTNSALTAYSTASALATDATTTHSGNGPAVAAAVAATSGAKCSLAMAATNVDTTGVICNVTFTPDTAGKYVVTLAATGTATQAITTNHDTIEVIVGGASLVQAASGLGTATGTQTTGSQSAVAVWLPAASDNTGRYSVTATGATIVGAYAGASVTDAATANTYTSATGITKNNGVDYATGFTYAGARTVTAATVTSDASDSFIVQMTSTVAATATLTVKSINATTGVTTTLYTATVTYGVTPDLSLGLSTAYMTTPTTGGSSASSTTNAVARTAVKTLQTGIAQVKVTLMKSDGTTDARAHAVTASVAGSGMVLVDTTADTPGTAFRTSTNSSTNNIRYVHINADGTAGTGTITVTVTHAVTGVTSTLGTFTVTSYGDATKIAVSTTNFTIGKSGGDTTGQAATTRNSTGEVTNAGALNDSTTTPAFIIKATDANGNVAALASNPTIVSSDLLVVSSGTCATDGGQDTTYSSSILGFGYYNCAFTTAATAKSGGKATLTIRTPDPADATLYLTTTLVVTVGGTIGTATETLSLDKLSYVNGEQLVVTRAATDSSGNPVADGTASPQVTFNKAVGGTATIPAGTYVGGKSANATSAAKSTTFAPSTPGAFVALATSGNTAATALTATSSVIDANAGIATQIDALNAKIVALNALIAKIMKKLGVK